MTMMRQIRAVSRIAVTWGVAFSALGATVLLTGLALHVLPSQFFGVERLANVIVRAFAGGAVAGTVFATVFARAERDRTLATLSMRRVALWGFIGSGLPAAIALGLGAPRILPIGVMGAAFLAYGVIGGSLATLMVKIARRSTGSISTEGVTI